MPQPRRWVSRAVSNIEISAIKEMAIRSARVKDVASLTWGVPSFRTPEYIRSAVSSTLESGEVLRRTAIARVLYALAGGALIKFLID